MFKKINSFFHRPAATSVTERSIVLHQEQVSAQLKEQKEKGTPIPGLEMLKEETINKEFFDAHPLAKGFGI